MKKLKSIIVIIVFCFSFAFFQGCKSVDPIDQQVVDKKLEKKRADSILLLDSLFDETLYRDNEIATIKDAKETCIKEINRAKTDESVDRAVNKFKDVIKGCKLKADYEKSEEFIRYKEEVRNSLGEYANLSLYRANEKAMINNAINLAKTEINKSINQKEVNDAYAKFKNTVDGLKTDSMYKVEESFKQLKDNALVSVTTYVNLVDYRSTEQIQVQSALATAKTEINQANNQDEINLAVSKYKDTVNKLKTNAEYSSDEYISAYKATAINEITNYQTSSSYEGNNLVVYQTTIANGINSIENAQSESEIDLIVSVIKGLIDNIAKNN